MYKLKPGSNDHAVYEIKDGRRKCVSSIMSKEQAKRYADRCAMAGEKGVKYVAERVKG